ncbi:glucuronosyltransferase [Altererythrobacter arenosus]|uniref:Glucuronosyltransferase n=1 Tax=Altererythrobacter arenosus TaxID=3032592 RepID=A0ABY8FM95_9SPHN|nr:glucuronosyltransferase [Altererythrobacter sp. CAU 1644]WFL75977.1 glucuronosyltransferase [Altererythrobacter sp. CAU 1644]
MKRVLAVASGGGHWEQLMLLADAFAGHEVRFATTAAAQAEYFGVVDAMALPDCNLGQPLRSLGCAIVSLGHLVRSRPDVVISTGAAPGLFCILWGRMLGAQTLWIDSIANAERLSLSGRLATRIAHRCLTQWEHLADGKRVQFAGGVL